MLSSTRPAHDHAHAEVDFGSPPLLPQNAPSPAAWLAMLIIALYRKAVSPLLPPACRFVPSCSEYGYEAVARYGILAGGRMAVWYPALQSIWRSRIRSGSVASNHAAGASR